MIETKGKQSDDKRGFYGGRVSYQTHLFVRAVYLMVDILLLLPAFLVALVSRVVRRPVDVGLGPLPSINSPYHKLSLERFGYRAETFVYYTWYFTDRFDVMLNKYWPRAIGPYVSYVYCLFRYRCLYIYFTGGPLGFTTLLARCEPVLLKLAGIKTVVMPFGADVHVLSRSKNRLMVDAYAKDYPGMRHSERRTAAFIDLWTHWADHIVSGCDWVDFTYYWDTLTLAHFAIDTSAFQPVEMSIDNLDEVCSPLRIVHAPNHRNLKGTSHLLTAVEELRAEGVSIDLTVVEGVPNSKMLDIIRASDVVVDQLVLGWYAMFALEAMALGKPVLCYIRQDLKELYTGAGLLQRGELPIIEVSIDTLKDTLRNVSNLRRRDLREIGTNSRSFVERRHSTEAIGALFDKINRSMHLLPSNALLMNGKD